MSVYPFPRHRGLELLFNLSASEQAARSRAAQRDRGPDTKKGMVAFWGHSDRQRLDGVADSELVDRANVHAPLERCRLFNSV